MTYSQAQSVLRNARTSGALPNLKTMTEVAKATAVLIRDWDRDLAGQLEMIASRAELNIDTLGKRAAAICRGSDTDEDVPEGGTDASV